MSGLVSYSYDPGSDQEAMSDSPHSCQEMRDRKDEKESHRKSDPERERERAEERGRDPGTYEGEWRERETRDRHVNRERSSRRDREDRSPYRSKRPHKHRRRHRDSSSESDSSERHRSHRSPDRYRSPHSPRHRHADRRHSVRSRRHRELTPPRPVTSAPDLPGDARPSLQYWPGYGAQLTPEQKLEVALTAMKSGCLAATGNPLGMSREKFRDLQSKKKRLWSKDEEEKSTVSKTENVYLTATSSMPLDQEKKEKFSKLMGLKSSEAPPPSPVLDPKQYEKTQQDLQQQYDQSRVHTHLMKGSGLGYGNFYQV